MRDEPEISKEIYEKLEKHLRNFFKNNNLKSYISNQTWCQEKNYHPFQLITT